MVNREVRHLDSSTDQIPAIFMRRKNKQYFGLIGSHCSACLDRMITLGKIFPWARYTRYRPADITLIPSLSLAIRVIRIFNCSWLILSTASLQKEITSPKTIRSDENCHLPFPQIVYVLVLSTSVILRLWHCILTGDLRWVRIVTWWRV